VSYTPIHFAQMTGPVIGIYVHNKRQARAYPIVGVLTLRDIGNHTSNAILPIPAPDLAAVISHDYDTLAEIESNAPDATIVSDSIYAACLGKTNGVLVILSEAGQWELEVQPAPDPEDVQAWWSARPAGAQLAIATGEVGE
jgi:hypothetical protein